MKATRFFFVFLSLSLSLFSSLSKAQTSPCEKDMAFAPWFSALRTEALSAGISEGTWTEASPFMKYDLNIIKKDRAQGVFSQTFLQFSDRMASEGRRLGAIKRIKTTYKALFDKIEAQFGVPAEPIAAFWALESDFGAVTGSFHVLTGLTTLAYDCRRADLFRGHLIDALRLIQRGDLKAPEMIGNWAGELGATQFMASDYLESGVDFDGDGKVNLIKSVPDTLATSANFLLKHGWKRAEPWMIEVQVPEQMPWEQSDLSIWHPVSQWKAWGVQTRNTSRFPTEDLQASLVLPMGRLGPSFLVFKNFEAFLGWNSALVYSTTASYFATRLAGKPAMFRGHPELQSLTFGEMVELQSHLNRLGYNVGKPDGKLGLMTRAAVKQAQLKYGFAADSYPTQTLLVKLRNSK